MAQQYQDINNKTGVTGLKGTSGKTYNNVHLLDSGEITEMLTDGIAEWTPPVKVVQDESLRNQRYRENLVQANIVITNAENNPITGTVYDPDTQGGQKLKARADKHRLLRANKKTGITDQDDALASYIDSVHDALDLADDAVELMDRTALDAYEASTHSYPVWIAPV